MDINRLRHLFDQLCHGARDCFRELLCDLLSDVDDCPLRDFLDEGLDAHILYEERQVGLGNDPELHPWDLAQNRTE